eukprot:3516387-Ditylum_brightwellii.AAC.1
MKILPYLIKWSPSLDHEAFTFRIGRFIRKGQISDIVKRGYHQDPMNPPKKITFQIAVTLRGSI